VGSGRSVSVTRVRQQGRPAGKEDCNDVGTAIESICHPTNVVPVLWEQGHRHAGKDNLSDDLVAVPWLWGNLDNRQPYGAGTFAFDDTIEERAHTHLLRGATQSFLVAMASCGARRSVLINITVYATK
jgi:hypothetical protein